MFGTALVLPLDDLNTPSTASARTLDQTTPGVVRAGPSALAICAATPATCGAAIDVPDMTLVAVVLPIHAEVMLEPGANTSTQRP
jgi:hypothetical protein